MKISTKLTLSSILIIGTVLVFLGAVFYGFVQTESNTGRLRIAEEILKTSLTAKVLQYDYMETGTERPKAQWYALQDSLNSTLVQGKPFFAEEKSKEIFNTIFTNQEKRKAIFDALVIAKEQEDNSELVRNLDGQLAVMAQERVEQATRLAELSHEEDKVTRKMLSPFLIVLGFITIIVSLISYLVGRRISRSLTVLEQDFTRIASLDFSTTTTSGKDELGMLSRSFGVMLSKLKESYALLEKKIGERTEVLQGKTKDLDDQKIAILNILEDTELKKQKIDAEKEKLDAILHSIGDGVFVVDKDLKVVLINEVASKMTGWKTEEILGTKYTEKLKFVFENTGKINDQFINNSISTKTVQEMANHTALVNKFNENIQVADSAAPLLDKDGNIAGCVVVFRDVTKEREIDRTKTEFVSLASHQLKTPVGAISWNLEMLLAGDYGKVSDKQKEILQESYVMNMRMNELINALLNVSRLETGVFIIEPKPIDFIKLCEEVIKEMESRLEKKGHGLIKNFDTNIPLIPADEKLLRIIFQNFISNAIKYTPDKGKIILNLKVDNDNIVFSVANNGNPIPEADQSKIFDKMFRASNAQEQDPDGNGLGLYIVKQIVENGKGKIWFTSKKDEDTVFACSFPLSGMIAKSGSKQLS